MNIVSEGRFINFLRSKNINEDDTSKILVDVSIALYKYNDHDSACVPLIKKLKGKHGLIISCDHTSEYGLPQFNFHMHTNPESYYSIQYDAYCKSHNINIDPIEISKVDNTTTCIEIYDNNKNVLTEFYILSNAITSSVINDLINLNTLIQIDDVTIQRNESDYCIYQHTKNTYPYQKIYITNDMVNMLGNKLLKYSN